MRPKLIISCVIFLALATGERAVLFGAALFRARESLKVHRAAPVVAIPSPPSFRDVPGRGLLIRIWVNSTGSFSCAIYTGAGATILSERVAAQAGVTLSSGRTMSVAGLSGARSSRSEEHTSELQ